MIDNYVHSNAHHIDAGHACPAQKESKLGRWLSDMRERYRNQVSSSAYTCTFSLFRSVLFGIHVYHKALISSMCMHAWNGEQELAAGKIAALKAIGVVFNGSEARKLRASIEMNIAKAGPAQPSVSHESVSQSVSHSLPTLRFKIASEEDEWSKMFG